MEGKPGAGVFSVQTLRRPSRTLTSKISLDLDDVSQIEGICGCIRRFQADRTCFGDSKRLCSIFSYILDSITDVSLFKFSSCEAAYPLVSECLVLRCPGRDISSDFNKFLHVRSKF